MWNEIRNDDELLNFLKKVHYFHDSCIKEIKYLSGAYVEQDLAMYPINDQRLLNVIIQCQDSRCSVIEMEFSKLKTLKLIPISENYTCEILKSTMFFKDGHIHWYDRDMALLDDGGTYICADSMRWRIAHNRLGSKRFW